MQSPLERLQTRRPARERTLKQLNIVRVVAVLDALLLMPLVYAAITDREGLVNVLGPLHGVGFLILVALTARGAVGRLWGWWFPALVVVTLGPPGSFIGDVRIRRGARRSSG